MWTMDGKTMRRFLALGFGWGFALFCGAVAAQEQKVCRAEPMPVRRCLISLGDESRTAGDNASACTFYKAAALISSSSGLVLDIVRCELAQGNVDEAYRMTQRCIADAANVPISPSQASSRAECESVRTGIHNSTGALVVEWACEASECGEVTVDSVALPRASWGAARRVKPGRYTVRAHRAGKVIWEQRVTVEAAKTTSAWVTLPPLTETPHGSAVPSEGQEGTVTISGASPPAGWDRDIGITPVAVGYQYRQIDAAHHIGVTASIQLVMPGIGFGDRLQLRPYASYRHEAHGSTLWNAPADYNPQSTGIEVDVALLGIVLTHNSSLGEHFRFVSQFGAGLGISYIKSGQRGEPLGGVFKNYWQSTGFHADGWGSNTYEFTCAAGVLRRISGGLWLGVLLRAEGGVTQWDKSVFYPDTVDSIYGPYPKGPVSSQNLGFSIGLGVHWLSGWARPMASAPPTRSPAVVAPPVEPAHSAASSVPAAPQADFAAPSASKTPVAGAGARDFDKDAVRAALAAAAKAAQQCSVPDGPTGTASVRIVLAPSGDVISAKVEGAPLAGTPVGDCIASAFRSARVPAFDGSSVAVTKTVTIDASKGSGDDIY